MLICEISLFNKIGKDTLNEVLKIENTDWRDLVTVLVTDYFLSTTQIVLMPYLQIDKANVTKILNNLEEKELIYREENPEDREKRLYV